MTNEQYPQLLDYLAKSYPNATGVLMDPKELVFEEVVKQNCYYCGRYGQNWRCPPNLPAVDYPKMMREFDKGLFVYLTYTYKTTAEFDAARTDSSVQLHKLLLNLEKWMYYHNAPTAISFIGGSCKLCKGGCGKDRCNNPYLSRSPLEATGVNIIKSAKKYGIDIRFPTDKQMIRLGLLLWQEESL